MSMEEGSDIDYIFENVVGGGGLWQWAIVIIMYPIVFASGFPLILHMFTAYAPEFRCFVPGCDDPSMKNESIMDNTILDFALPKEYSSTEMFTTADHDPCHMYQNDGSGTCSAEAFDNTSTVACESYVYDRNLFPETLTTKLDLVCDEESKRRLLSTIMMLGLMIGSLIGGRISDRFGRKKAAIGSVIVIVPTVFFGGFAQNYATYAVLRLITCSSLPVMWVSMHSMTLEIFDKHHRKSVVIFKDFLWPTAQMILILIVYLVRHWSQLHFWFGGLGLIAFPCLYLVPESPRWLANNGHKDQAEEVLLQAAKRNKKTVTLEQNEQIRQILDKVEKDSKHQTEKNLNIIDLFKKANVKKTLIVLLNWITACLSSYTLLLNSTRLHGDLFINFLLSAILGDIPGTLCLLFTLTHFSRRTNLFFFQMVTGTCCLILAFVPKENTYVVLVFFLIGKCGTGAAFLIVWVVTAELYPTNLRSQAVGFCSTIARVFSLLCPFVATLAAYWKPLPMVILGIPGIIAGGLAFLIPETDGVELPQNMKDTLKDMTELQPMTKKEEPEE